MSYADDLKAIEKRDDKGPGCGCGGSVPGHYRDCPGCDDAMIAERDRLNRFARAMAEAWGDEAGEYGAKAATQQDLFIQGLWDDSAKEGG